MGTVGCWIPGTDGGDGGFGVTGLGGGGVGGGLLIPTEIGTCTQMKPGFDGPGGELLFRGS